MGNELGTYKGCSLTKSYETTNCPFAVYAGNAQDGTEVSVFVYSEEEGCSDMVQNSVKYLKTLKHPGIVKLLGVDKSQDEHWLVTEHVKPLEAVVDSLDEEEICAGLNDVVQVMAFIHERGRLCHNSLTISSVFVAEGGAWKIAGLECICPFDKATSSELSRISKCRPQICIAPEEKKGYKLNIDLGHARDSFAFGHLAEQLLELISSKSERKKTFELRLQDECLSEDPRQRPQFSSFFNDQLFKSDFINILQFLRTLTVQSQADKQEFFRHVVAKLYELPPSLVASRLVRPLLARFVLLEKTAVEHLLPHLLTPCEGSERTGPYCEGEINPLLPAPLFQQYVIPELFKIFHVRDTHIRIALLRHFRKYCHLFEPQLMRTVLLPQVLLGLRDINDELGELSLRALADLVPILGGDNVISAHRHMIFSSGIPNFKKKVAASATVNGGVIASPAKRSSVKAGERSSSKDVAKEQERERRREEARKRAEERRLKREQRKKQPQKAEVIEDDAPAVKTIESDDGGPIDINKKKSDWTEGDDVSQEVSQSEDPSQNSDDIDPDKLNTSLDRTESDFDDEIEKELDAMESTLPKDKLEKIQTRSETIDLIPDVKVDWSDISAESSRAFKNVNNNGTSKKGVLKLKSPVKTKLSPPPSESTSLDLTENENALSSSHDSSSFRNRKQSNEMDDWGSNWDDINPDDDFSQPKSPKSPSTPQSPQSPAVSVPKSTKTVAKNSKSARKTGPPRVQDNLGADLDIKSMDDKNFKGSNEFDFFADMAPKIKSNSDDLLDMLSQSSKKSSEKGKKAEKSSLSFAVQDTGDFDAAGGWENDDFEW